MSSVWRNGGVGGGGGSGGGCGDEEEWLLVDCVSARIAWAVGG